MPTTIGPITTVPVPGDPVASQWANDITKFAVNDVTIGPTQPTDPNAELWYDTSDAGASLANMPRGFVAQGIAMASQGPISVSPTNVTGLTVTFQTDGTRRFKYSWKLRLTKDATAAPVWLELMNGAAVIDTWFQNIPASNEVMVIAFTTEVPPAGTVTRNLRIQFVAGAVTITATAANKSLLVAEDIGT